MKSMQKQELEMIERLSNELKVLAENGYTLFDLACYVDLEIDNTSESHSNAYFRFLYELKDLYLDLAESDKDWR